VRREDVENGFRWVIERSSLDRKIEQELEFEARRKSAATSLSDRTDADGSEPVRTGANRMEDELASVSLTEQVQTGANPSAPVSEGAPAQQSDRLAKASTEPVRTSADKAEPVGDQGDVVKQLEARIEDLKSEIEFYRDELRDRRHTTEALTDVIEAFRLTAQSNASKAFERTDNRRSHDIRSTNAGDRWPGENAGDGV
jgi:aspartate oxidase